MKKLVEKYEMSYIRRLGEEDRRMCILRISGAGR